MNMRIRFRSQTSTVRASHHNLIASAKASPSYLDCVSLARLVQCEMMTIPTSKVAMAVQAVLLHDYIIIDYCTYMFYESESKISVLCDIQHSYTKHPLSLLLAKSDPNTEVFRQLHMYLGT